LIGISKSIKPTLVAGFLWLPQPIEIITPEKIHAKSGYSPTFSKNTQWEIG
jgi:hypothetical protein